MLGWWGPVASPRRCCGSSSFHVSPVSPAAALSLQWLGTVTRLEVAMARVPQSRAVVTESQPVNAGQDPADTALRPSCCLGTVCRPQRARQPHPSSHCQPARAWQPHSGGFSGIKRRPRERPGIPGLASEAPVTTQPAAFFLNLPAPHQAWPPASNQPQTGQGPQAKEPAPTPQPDSPFTLSLLTCARGSRGQRNRTAMAYYTTEISRGPATDRAGGGPVTPHGRPSLLLPEPSPLPPPQRSRQTSRTDVQDKRPGQPAGPGQSPPAPGAHRAFPRRGGRTSLRLPVCTLSSRVYLGQMGLVTHTSYGKPQTELRWRHVQGPRPPGTSGAGRGARCWAGGKLGPPWPPIPAHEGHGGTRPGQRSPLLRSHYRRPERHEVPDTRAQRGLHLPVHAGDEAGEDRAAVGPAAPAAFPGQHRP